MISTFFFHHALHWDCVQVCIGFVQMSKMSKIVDFLQSFLKLDNNITVLQSNERDFPACFCCVDLQ